MEVYDNVLYQGTFSKNAVIYFRDNSMSKNCRKKYTIIINQNIERLKTKD